MVSEQLKRDLSSYCDTWESLNHLQTKLVSNENSISNSIEEVKSLLDSLINKTEKELSLQGYSNIDELIDKLKGS